jgi:hypothetical protein
MLDKGNLDNSKRMVKTMALAFMAITIITVSGFALAIIGPTLIDMVNVNDDGYAMAWDTALPDSPAKGVAYEMDVSVTGKCNAELYPYIQFSETSGIASGDVVLTYFDGTAFVNVPLTMNIHGKLGAYLDPITISNGSLDILEFTVMFTTSGSYMVELYGEA